MATLSRGGTAGAERRTDVGRRAELAVGDYLRAHGFEILARNLRVGRLELDLVARKGPLLVVVEVRTRGASSYEGAFESVTPVKRARVMRAVDGLCRRELATWGDVERIRIDAAAVTFDRGETRVEYVEGAITG